MRILIYGAGATGQYLAGHLALAGHTVTLVHGTQPPHPTGIDEIHLKSESGARPITVEVNRLRSLAEAARQGKPDWVGLALPAYETGPAGHEIAQTLSPNVPLISFQTGIGHTDTLSSILGHEQITAGTLTTTLSMDAPDLVTAERRGGVCIATEPEGADTIVQAFRATSLSVTTTPSVETLTWSKLFVDLIANAIPAILDVHPREALQDTRVFDMEWAALREALWAMRQKNVQLANLPGAPARTLAELTRRLPRQILRLVLMRRATQRRGTPPSLLAELRAGRRQTEAAWLNGAVVFAADSTGHLAPINHALALTVTDIAAGRVPWGMFQHNPDMLLTAIRLAQGQPNPHRQNSPRGL